jgi:zinc D-Ala-D-Ala carboxypeptidase|tara:strand:- start:1659 stop:2117 length:459 start_codon:yes stop_codon:yes gene_type:complete
MKLTENFSLNELTKSQTAERKGIDNTPSPEHQDNLKSLCTYVLQPIRDHFSRVVSISSGYRSPELCVAIGSKITSQHASGCAADFEIFGVSNKELADYINEELDYDQLILEYWKESDPNSGWVHCSYSKNNNRKQYLKAVKIDGITRYESMV